MVGLLLLEKAVGARIREFREKQGLSQEQFASICGLHRTFVGTVERGETNLSLQSMATIAMGLDVTLSELFEGVESRAQKITNATAAKEQQKALRKAKELIERRRAAQKKAAELKAAHKRALNEAAEIQLEITRMRGQRTK